MTQPKAYSYLRFSSPEQAKGDSARRQETAAIEYAQQEGLDLDAGLTFRDLGVSAYRGRNAADGRLGDFLQAVRAGVVPPGSYLLVENLDRISRLPTMKAMDILRALVEAGVTVVTLVDRVAYTSENIERDIGRLLTALLFFARAHEESATKARRVREAWDRKKREAASAPLTRVCPAWLRLKEDRSGFEVIPERGEVVRRIYEMAASGMGHTLIAKTLNAEGVPTFGDFRRPGAAHWQRTYVGKILASDTALGTFTPHSGRHEGGKLVREPWDPVPNYYPAVVDEETARRARLVTGPGRNPKRGRHAAHPVQNILAGLARCPLCGGTMTRVSKGDPRRGGLPKLVCTTAKAGAGCEYRSTSLSLVEYALRDSARELVYKDTLEEQDPELDMLHERAAALGRNVANLVAALEQGSESPAILGRLRALEAEQREVTDGIRARTAHIADTREPLVERRLEDLRSALQAEPFDVEVANAALRLCASKVVVDFLSGNLLVHWRHGGVTDLIFAWPQEPPDL